jgi:hypothetical protein
MTTIKALLAGLTPKTENKPKKITFIFDESGSTGSEFSNSIKIIEKEEEIMHQYILKNLNNLYDLYTFESRCLYHQITVLKDENFVTLPTFSSKGSTYTHLPFVEINKKKEKPDLIIVITDGQTNSSGIQLKNEMDKLAKENVTLEIIAVSGSSNDMNTLTHSEEQSIPGMDLINHLANYVNRLTIYNKCHNDVPYEGANSTKINKAQLNFMEFAINCRVNEFIDKLCDKIIENKGMINWGINNIDFKKMLSELGKLLTVYFTTFNPDHYYINLIANKINDNCMIENMNIERIINIIKYGFECTKKEKPVLYTNFEQHVKEASVKKAEFKDAIFELNNDGTTLQSSKTICMPTNGVCIINNGVIEMTQNLGNYPKSKDKYSNIFFPCDDNINEQAVRIAFRELCGQQGFYDKLGPEPAFYVLKEMSLMFIKGIDLTTEHMIELRKLAIIQTNMETVTGKDKYDGVGLYKQWKVGKTVPVHYTKQTTTHSHLYKNIKINPLQLEETLWWALMMSMLGLFEEQRCLYNTTLLSINVSNETEFLNYMRETYAKKINGNIGLYVCNEKPTSFFTLDMFLSTDIVYTLKDHGNCKTKTCYSKDEIENYVLNNGCIWCKYMPSWNDFEQKHYLNDDIEINNLMTSCARLSVTIDNIELNKFNKSSNKLLINMIGITGAGKSTISQKIYDLVIANNGSCLIVSSDKWSKRGVKGKQLQSSVYKEIAEFDSKQSEHKVIIVDLCNENGPQLHECFGYDISSYTITNYYPNFNKEMFDEYQSWCLQNVLCRQNCTPETNFWLNPVSAGVNTCVKVHNMKTNGIKKLLGITSTLSFPESKSIDYLLFNIKPKADAYALYLSTINTDKNIQELLVSNGFVIA